MRRLLLGSSLALLSLGGLAAGRAEDGAFYAGLHGIAGYTRTGSSVATGFQGSARFEKEHDGVLGVGGALGYAFARWPLRAEVGLDWRYRYDLDVRDVGGPGGTVDYEADVSTVSVLAGLAWEWRRWAGLTPYAGPLIGWSRTSADTERNAFVGVRRQRIERDTASLSWGAVFGVDWSLGRHWSAGLAYRYLDLGEVETGTFAGGDGYASEDRTTHDVLVRVRRRF